MDTIIIDMNIATVQNLAKSGRAALYGDATQPAILQEAGIGRATHLIVTLPAVESLATLVLLARELNEKIEVIVRTRYLADGDGLRAAGASHVVFDEGETGVSLARLALERRGIEPATMQRVLAAIRQTWKMTEPPPAPPSPEASSSHAHPRPTPLSAPPPSSRGGDETSP
jgi:CPA2 family monovalent cation:H+ antiporter-2